MKKVKIYLNYNKIIYFCTSVKSYLQLDSSKSMTMPEHASPLFAPIASIASTGGAGAPLLLLLVRESSIAPSAGAGRCP